MSILSLEFLVFIIAVVAVNYILPVRFRWVGFLAGSLTFYGFAGWQGLAYLLTVTLVTWGGGLWMARSHRKEKAFQEDDDKAGAYRTRFRRGRMLGKLVLLVIGGMCVIKYADILYFLANEAYLFITKSRESLATVELFVPLGLSYFTFQSVGYVVDCARGKVQPEKNPLKYLTFLSFFPQITQGPITTHKQLMPQLLHPKRFDAPLFVEGFQLMLWGYFKKLVLADRLALITAQVLKNAEQPGWLILLGAATYIIRLYGDFSGGMDVIRGAARMLGVDIIENFRRPFFSVSVAEFWRRWHISLGAWFRTYLFYPLTTSRFGLGLGKIGQKLFGKKVGRTLPGVLATFIIFFLIGVWHAANWNAVIYGAYFGLLLSGALLLEPLFKKLRSLLHINPKWGWWKALGMLRTWVLIVLPQYFAFTPGPEKGWALLTGTFRNWDFARAGAFLTEIGEPLEWMILGGAALIVFVVDLLCECRVDVNGRLARTFFPIRWVVLIVLILLILLFGQYGAGADATAFLYTNF